ncbi:hypothetical protein SteCoe_27270 [Stentor coeruleus]|uniref:Uncharacterized protein n=1 Tax=Stentor coeruleus TaxID=5963 RepID=A0A1R2BAX1_9CILI|nr:hypothetical protein SteCoe_27270 [Stentor coeruleus]
MKIPGSVSVITGGASGLGEATVRLFHSLGSKIAIWDMSLESGEKIVKELASNIIFCKVDITDENSVRTALESTLKAFGKVNILINCAGIAIAQKTITSSMVHRLADFDIVIKVNLLGTFNVSRLVAKQMASQGEEDKEKGVIIHVASVAGYEGQKGQAAYGASKGGVIGLTLPMARDLASYGIRVNTVAPGVIGDTRMSNAMSAEVYKQLCKVVPLGRLGVPFEFANSVKFLVENTYMTGSVIRVDGGIRLPHI